MIKYDFWDVWKEKTDVELEAIRKVKRARELVIVAVPRDKLYAIYIKGSFTRREMKRGSDVDMVPIVTEDEYQGTVFGVNVPEIDPVCVVPLSLNEFETNELHTRSDHSPDLRAKPDRFLKKLSECKLIYGEPLDPSKYLIREDRQALLDGIKIIREGYIPLYQAGRTSFSGLLKEVFWLVELELNVRGIPVEHSFEGIMSSVKDRDHIIHDAFKFRIGEYGKAQEEAFVARLIKYLSDLEKLV